MRRYWFAVFLGLSTLLLCLSWRKDIAISLLESWGFVTGAACVWLTVEENIWNWPIGIANSVFFFSLFLSQRLFADMTLQIVYVILGFIGWYWWLRGGRNRTELAISRTPRLAVIALAAIGVVATVVMTRYLQSVKDSAPFLDALTTVLSLIAQYMLTRKLLENWFVWMTADIIYIGLYAYKNLYLTALLYAIFFGMCVAGFLQWRTTHSRLEPLHA